MKEIAYAQFWDNFSYDLYLRYLEAKFSKEEQDFLNKQNEQEEDKLNF